MITVTDNHEYLKDNLTIIPSVSNLVQFATKEDYSGIPEEVLQRAADFGNTIHQAIEDYLTTETETEFYDQKLNNSWNEFLRLKNEHIGEMNLIEQQIDYRERYGGRIDLLSDGVLIDFKTNYRFDDKLKKHLEWQLGYYKMALEQKGLIVNECYCLYLPKTGKGKWIKITPIKDEELIENLEQYEQATRDYELY